MPGNNSALLVREAAGFTNPLPQAILTGQENINTIQPAPMLFDHNAWFAQNTTPGAPTTVASLTPQQLQAAQNVTYVSIGPPVHTVTTPRSYQVKGI
ncbi:hypothetical protein ACKAV7_011925 [Fusarium commune]